MRTAARPGSACTAGTLPIRCASPVTCGSPSRRWAGARTSATSRSPTTSPRWRTGTRPCPAHRFRPIPTRTSSKSSDPAPRSYPKADTMKTRRLLIPVAAATALVLAACGGGGGDAGADSNQVRFYHDKAQWEEQFGAIADLTLESNDIDLEVVGYADDAAYDSFIRSSFLTDERPDLFTWHTGGPLAELVEEGLRSEE